MSHMFCVTPPRPGVANDASQPPSAPKTKTLVYWYNKTMKKGGISQQPLIFHGNLEEITKSNRNYRQVLYTAKQMQLVAMSIQPGEFIPLEVHDDHDQFIRVDGGCGQLLVGKSRNGSMASHKLRDGIAAIVPAGVFHKVINSSRTRPLQLYSIYTPPEHRPGVVHNRMIA